MRFYLVLILVFLYFETYSDMMTGRIRLTKIEDECIQQYKNKKMEYHIISKSGIGGIVIFRPKISPIISINLKKVEYLEIIIASPMNNDTIITNANEKKVGQLIKTTSNLKKQVIFKKTKSNIYLSFNKEIVNYCDSIKINWIDYYRN